MPRAAGKSNVGAFAGVVLGVLGLLSSVWIPTLAALFALGALVFGLTQGRHSSGSRRAWSTFALVLGSSGIFLTVLVVLVTTDWS